MIRWNASSKVPPGGDSGRSVAGFRGERSLVLGFVLLSAALSTLILGLRNFSDDEIFSLPFVTGSVQDILEVAREGDVHPPGMYLLGHAAWRILPSDRWLNLLPEAVLFAGLGMFLLGFMPELRGRRAVVCALLFGALHPELLMWSNTLRWYCPWTGLALMTLAVFLQPREREWRLGWGRCAAGLALLTAMFYLNYMTLLFVVALGLALWMRLRGVAVSRVSRWTLLACGVGFGVSILPQLRTMITVHLANSAAQRSNLAVAAARLAQALLESEAYLPWSAMAVIAMVVSLWVVGGGLRAGADVEGGVGGRTQRSLTVFGIGFLLLVIVSGLGGKPRNAILLIPVFAPAVGAGVQRLGRRMQWAVVAVFAVWCGWGAVHLAGRFGQQKSRMNDRPEEVVRLIAQGAVANRTTDAQESCGLAVTYDSGLALVLAAEHVPRLMIVSPFRGAMFAGRLDDLPAACGGRVRLYVVQSYASGEPERDWKYIQELNAAKGFIEGKAEVSELSRDPDAAMKRRLSRVLRLEAGRTLPDYRFEVFSGEMDRTRLAELRRALHHFVSGEGVVPDWPGDNQPGM